MKRSNVYLTIIAILVAVRVFEAQRIVGYANDILGCFHFWAKNIQLNGISFAYISNEFGIDYPPVYLYVLWILGAFINFSSSWWNNHLSVLIMKLPALLADFTLAYLAYKIAKENNKNSYDFPYICSIIVLICPTMFINSAYWGQIDAFFCLLLLLSLYYGSKKEYVLCSILYILALLTKPQAAIFAPLILIFAVECLVRKKFKEFAIAIASCLLLLFIICLPVSPYSGYDIWWIKDKLFSTINAYPYACLNANNLYYALGLNYVLESKVAVNWTLIKFGVPIVASVFVILFWCLSKINRTTKTFLLASILMLTIFNFMPEMHERYSFPAVIFLAFTLFSSGNWLFFPVWLMTTIASGMNHYWVLVPNIWYKSTWIYRPIWNLGDLWASMFIASFALTLILTFTLKGEKTLEKTIDIENTTVEA